MSPSSSISEAFGFLVAHGPVVAVTAPAAWLQAMLDAEASLAGAQADVGDVPAAAAAAIAAACRVERFDVGAVLAAAESGGTAVIPLVAAIRDSVGPDAAGFVHLGATSQDIADAATAVVVGNAARVVGDALSTASEAAAALGARHGTAPMIGRTLGQWAVPTTFATVTGRWSDGLAEAARSVAATEAVPVGLGGPAGDGASFGIHHGEIAERFARSLHARPVRVAGHTQRSATAAVAGAWGAAASAVAKVALDVVLLAQSDVGEVAERAPGAGGSSSMPHKQNPIAAVSARAAAIQAPGLVATLLHAAGGHELERAAGAWHAEWPALDRLLRVTGSAVDWLQTSLDRLVVDTDRMAANVRRATAEQGGPP